ncbi:MAG: SLC13 family permease [Myxococcota bacterium]|nr:SLC13 family permease [Myxococcota bacterium]
MLRFVIAAWITLAVVALMIVGLLQERLSPDTLVLGALVLLMLFGIIEPVSALRGFASPSVITVGALFVIAGAIRNTGALGMISERLFGGAREIRPALARLTTLTGVGSAFLSNTAIVAMFLPVVFKWAERQRISPSWLLIPLSYAAVVGGVCTLIGTSTNLVVSGLLEQRGLPGFSMFELAWVGIPCLIVALSLIVLLAPRVLPERIDVLSRMGAGTREYLVEMRLESESPLVGQRVEEAGLRQLSGLFLVRVERGSGVISPVGPGEYLRAQDRLTFAGVVETIVDLQQFRGLVPEVHDRPPEADDRWVLHEAVVSGGSPLIGLSIREANFRGRYSAAVVAVHRHGERIESKLGDIQLRAGDTLLLEAASGFSRSFRDSTDFYLVSEVDESAPPRHHRAAWALAILGGVVGLSASGALPIVAAALAGAVGVVAVGCLSPGQARRSIDVSVLIVIAASFGLARALEESGAAGMIGAAFVGISEPWGPVAVLAGVYLATLVLTEMVSNNAAAALMFPIALVAASAVEADPRPFAIGVAIAASLSLATPLGYQTNLMVYGPGGYRFSDFLRMGLPLQLLLGILSVALIAFLWSV